VSVIAVNLATPARAADVRQPVLSCAHVLTEISLPFHAIPDLGQDLSNAVQLLTLNFDLAVFQRAASSALQLELGQQTWQIVPLSGKTANDGDPFTVLTTFYLDRSCLLIGSDTNWFGGWALTLRLQSSTAFTFRQTVEWGTFKKSHGQSFVEW
jgi:hypothetical protein